MSIKPSNTTPWEVVLADGSTSTSYVDVMEHWKHDFERLLNYQNDRTIELCDLPDIPINHVLVLSILILIYYVSIFHGNLGDAHYMHDINIIMNM